MLPGPLNLLFRVKLLLCAVCLVFGAAFWAPRPALAQAAPAAGEDRRKVDAEMV